MPKKYIAQHELIATDTSGTISRKRTLETEKKYPIPLREKSFYANQWKNPIQRA
ncbi:hypothetical protein WN48_09005 [Eufriesea mexicana]|uniref:Uncharacterized protein n=1 Tax=Eufriesea mexicana TaxID=516756 RepID=A0A310S676_9HYME|nr:hypothetical protein WN48_09005 [Eufriesea mexicana]